MRGRMIGTPLNTPRVGDMPGAGVPARAVDLFTGVCAAGQGSDRPHYA